MAGQGRKGNVEPFIPMSDDGAKGIPLEERAERAAMDLRPRGLTTSQRRIWDRIAPILWMNRRLQPLYLDVVIEYVRAVDRMAALRKSITDNGGETYESETRNGKQIKTRPEVGQLNLVHRQWLALVSHLRLSPATSGTLKGAIGDLFDDPEDGEFFD